GFTIDSTAGTGVGGLLALPTNIGRYASDSFSIMPEGEVQLGMYVTERLRVYGGYNFLYASQVARPGDQIDPFVNTNFLAFAPDPLGPIGPLRPDFALRRTDFWAQGFSLGVELDW
ncbi:MAG: BBP7 family outer membrane beta-barrel protein, partial [Planctomycetia bacterium]|nr:BBP7 family outer membrane beta-barrel protein [Planctomycetia bacterium]